MGSGNAGRGLGDFCSWIQFTSKPARPHWRYPEGGGPGTTTRAAAGTPNAVTGKPSAGRGYATATVVHCESVLRGFYDFHLEAGSGPIVNPFPLARGRGGRANAHHDPMDRFAGERTGQYRPRTVRRIPRQIPDDRFDELFAQLGSNRDRALVAFWVSTGARASELLGATAADADPGQQLITVIRKGTRQLHGSYQPASPDAFVWLRLYQAQMHGLVPPGRDQPLWWTLRRPFRALSYDAARLMFMFTRASGARWARPGPLHDLRQPRRPTGWPATRPCRWPTCSGFLAMRDLSTTQQYLTPLTEDVIATRSARPLHDRQREPGPGTARRWRPGTGPKA